MESAAKKLKNSRGASIILALVFLLVCVMVGSSVLMAASSNAGRSRSNRQEQQLYLFLSSALQLVEDDLTGAEYTCQVEYQRVKVPDSAFFTHWFIPCKGLMARKEGGSDPLFVEVFCPALDSISNGYMKEILEKLDADAGNPDMNTPGAHYWYDGYKDAEKTPQSFTLTVTPDGPLAGYEAQVDVTIDANYRITLTARMTGAQDTKALKLFQNYSLTTTLTRSGMVSLTIPSGENDMGPVILPAADAPVDPITWKAGQVVREYRAAEEAGP